MSYFLKESSRRKVILPNVFYVNQVCLDFLSPDVPVRSEQTVGKPPLSRRGLSQVATMLNNTCENYSNFHLLQSSHVLLKTFL